MYVEGCDSVVHIFAEIKKTIQHEPATPLPWRVSATGRWLCVPVFQRVCPQNFFYRKLQSQVSGKFLY